MVCHGGSEVLQAVLYLSIMDDLAYWFVKVVVTGHWEESLPFLVNFQPHYVLQLACIIIIEARDEKKATWNARPDSNAGSEI